MRSAQVYEVELEQKMQPKVSTRSDAACWGRIAAVKGWSLDRYLHDEVEERFHEVARQAYERRLIQLHGAPF